MFKFCAEEIIRKCVSEIKINNILSHCYDRKVGVHYREIKTTPKVIELDFSILLNLKMNKIMSPLPINVKEAVIFQKWMKCFLNLFLYVKYLIFGA